MAVLGDNLAVVEDAARHIGAPAGNRQRTSACSAIDAGRAAGDCVIVDQRAVDHAAVADEEADTAIAGTDIGVIRHVAGC